MMLIQMMAGNAQGEEPRHTAAESLVTPVSLQRAPRPSIVFGAYDPHDALNAYGALNIEHIFVAWQAPDVRAFDRKIELARRSRRTLMISVEPFTHAPDWRAGGNRLFSEILKGLYDSEINWVCLKARSAGVPIIMRWGHEMEDVDGRYPWARNDPAGYRKAFSYFVSSCREILPDARYVWSPKGSKNLKKFYPGDDYVDMIGIPIWGLQKMDLDYWKKERTFAETVREKYDRVSAFAKPVMIAELGVSGGADYRQNWYREILSPASYRKQFPLIRSVLFFNDKEPYHWPKGYGSPDWRLDKHVLPLLSDAGPIEVAEH